MESIKTNQELSLQLVGFWWAGAKLLLQWFVMGVVTTMFFLPVMPLIYLVGKQAGLVLMVAFYVLCMPIIIGLTAGYLHLFGEGGRDVNEPQESPTPVAGRNEGKMRMKIAVSGATMFLMAPLLTAGPDPLTALCVGVAGAFLCWVPLLVLARSRFMKSASPSVHTLVVALVWITVVLLLACLLFVQRISHMRRESVALTGLTCPTFMSALPSGLS
jgi:hypothetical protein